MANSYRDYFYYPQPALRVLLWIVVLLSLFGACDIADVFGIKPGTDDGGCQAYRDQLNDIWDDSVNMNNAALRLIRAAQSTDPAIAPETFQARRLVATFFGTELDYNEIEEWFNDVQTVLNGNTNNRRYIVFCDATFEMMMRSSDQAVGSDGSPVVNPATNRPTLIREDYTDIDFRSSAPYLVQIDWLTPRRYFYILDHRSFNPATYCSEPGSLGRTQHGNNDVCVLLCPASFTTGDGRASNLRLGAEVQDVGQDIQTVSCVAQTFYHELFHAVHERYGSEDNTGYGARDIISNAQGVLRRERAGTSDANEDTLQAPENYTWFALAAWYFYSGNVFFDAGLSNHVQPNP
ncbi:hypothetical protein F5Y13DRAFT_197765 [Hypoxylon sp. FL1857]|nr:hypothetical protein F5Y13DRAFT_197765 [Hypoxylon sp. FL1857]